MIWTLRELNQNQKQKNPIFLVNGGFLQDP